MKELKGAKCSNCIWFENIIEGFTQTTVVCFCLNPYMAQSMEDCKVPFRPPTYEFSCKYFKQIEELKKE